MKLVKAFYILGMFSLSVAPTAYGAGAAPNCNLEHVELEAKVDGENLVIKVQLNGQDTWMRLGTAFFKSEISGEEADNLKLVRREIRSNKVYNTSGKQITQYVMIDTVSLSGMTIRNAQFLVLDRPAVYLKKPTANRYSGVLGGEFLKNFDIEFDLSHGKVSLFSQEHCKGRVVYWTQDYAEIPFDIDRSSHITFPVTLDGKRVRALLSTSNNASELSSQAALRDFNFDPEAAGIKPDGNITTDGVDPRSFYRHRFGLLDIGGVEFHNTELVIFRDRSTRIEALQENPALRIQRTMDDVPTPLVIGLHHFARIRAFLAYSEQVLYVSAAGAN